MSRFQVKLGGEWSDYSDEEDKILKRAYMAGFPNARFQYRGQSYEYNFHRMVQINKNTRKERQIRAPRKWKRPEKPLVPAGPTTVVNVPAGSPGKTIQVPHPGVPGAFIAVNVPATARPGQAMLVPVPREKAVTAAGKPHATGPAAAAGGKTAAPKGGGWSTGGKVAAGTAAIVGVGGMAVGGALLGESIAEHDFDATVDTIGDGLADAGEAIGDFAVDAGDWIVDAGESAGDFMMDLF
jgi:hypothetical protein